MKWIVKNIRTDFLTWHIFRRFYWKHATHHSLSRKKRSRHIVRTKIYWDKYDIRPAGGWTHMKQCTFFRLQSWAQERWHISFAEDFTQSSLLFKTLRGKLTNLDKAWVTLSLIFFFYLAVAFKIVVIRHEALPKQTRCVQASIGQGGSGNRYMCHILQTDFSPAKEWISARLTQWYLVRFCPGQHQVLQNYKFK